MSDVLSRICREKRRHVARCKAERPLAEVEAAARRAVPPRGFRERLANAVVAGRPGLIAEIKRASPSRGLIRPDFDVAELAAAYKRGGAACLSVLTDTPFFQGEDAYLAVTRDVAGLPVLRKDFMLDPYQIIEARALGADCVLLILAALDDGEARELARVAEAYAMDVLVEVHDDDELERALTLDARMVGINNRDLKTLEVDLATTERLAPRVPGDRLIVCESGLRTAGDLARMMAVGVRCFLIGESLMARPDVEAATRDILALPDAPATRALA